MLTVHLHPASTGSDRLAKDETKNLKTFASNFESQKVFLPLHSQSQTGLANGKKRAAKPARTVTSNGSSTRSLNDGNRQNSKCLASFG
jgi:hypothetical protein